jgi:hypothetical protein
MEIARKRVTLTVLQDYFKKLSNGGLKAFDVTVAAKDQREKGLKIYSNRF